MTGALLFVPVLLIYMPQRQCFKTEVFRTEGGWGYNILRDGKIFIHQPSVPSVMDNRPFRTALSAKNAGEKVKAKLRHHELPSLTPDELKEAGYRQEN